MAKQNRSFLCIIVALVYCSLRLAVEIYTIVERLNFPHKLNMATSSKKMLLKMGNSKNCNYICEISIIVQIYYLYQ